MYIGSNIDEHTPVKVNHVGLGGVGAICQQDYDRGMSDHTGDSYNNSSF